MTQINASLLTAALQHLYDAQNLVKEALNENCADKDLLTALNTINEQLEITTHHLGVVIDYVQEA